MVARSVGGGGGGGGSGCGATGAGGHFSYSVHRRALLGLTLVGLCLWHSGRIVFDVLQPSAKPNRHGAATTTSTALLLLPPWREQPLLSCCCCSRGAGIGAGGPLEIPNVADAKNVDIVQRGSVALVVPRTAVTKIPNPPASSTAMVTKTTATTAAQPGAAAPSDRSAALQYVLDQLKLQDACRLHPEWLVVQVRGDFDGDSDSGDGDGTNFGLTVAAATGCRTILYESHEATAVRLAQSILLPENNMDEVLLSHTVKIRLATIAAAALPLQKLRTTSSSSVQHPRSQSSVFTAYKKNAATAQLDIEFAAHQTLVLLAIDGNGDGDGGGSVLATATNLLRDGRVRHVIVGAYHPVTHQLDSRREGTALPFLLLQAAATCYVLHTTKPIVYRLVPRDATVFDETLAKAQIQTVLYCRCTNTAMDPDVVEDVLFKSARVWTPSTKLDD